MGMYQWILSMAMQKYDIKTQIMQGINCNGNKYNMAVRICNKTMHMHVACENAILLLPTQFETKATYIAKLYVKNSITASQQQYIIMVIEKQHGTTE